MRSNWEEVINDHLPQHSVDVKLDHVFTTGIVHWITSLVLRVDDAGDQLLVVPLLVLGSDGDAGHEAAVTDHGLLDTELADQEDHLGAGDELIRSTPTPQSLSLLG